MTGLPLTGGSAVPQHPEQPHSSAPLHKSFEEQKQGDVRSQNAGRKEADVVDAEADVIESLLTLQFQSGNPGNCRVLQIATRGQEAARRPGAEDDPDGPEGFVMGPKSRPNSGAGLLPASIVRPNSFSGKKRKPLGADDEMPFGSQLNSYHSGDYREMASAVERQQLAAEHGQRRALANGSPTLTRTASGREGLAGRVPSDPLINGGQGLLDAVLIRMMQSQGGAAAAAGAAQDAMAGVEGGACAPSAKRPHVLCRPLQQQHDNGGGGVHPAGGDDGHADGGIAGGSGVRGLGLSAGAVLEAGTEDRAGGPERPNSGIQLQQHQGRQNGGAVAGGGGSGSSGGGSVAVKQEAPQVPAARRLHPPPPVGRQSDTGSDPGSPSSRAPPGPGTGAAAGAELQPLARRAGGSGGGGGTVPSDGGGTGIPLNGAAASFGADKVVLASGDIAVLNLMQLLAVRQRQEQQQQNDPQQAAQLPGQPAGSDRPPSPGQGLVQHSKEGQGGSGRPADMKELMKLAVAILAGVQVDRAPPHSDQSIQRDDQQQQQQQQQQRSPRLLSKDQVPVPDPRVTGTADLAHAGFSDVARASGAPVEYQRFNTTGSQHRGIVQEGLLHRQLSYNSRDNLHSVVGGDAMQVDSPRLLHRTTSCWAEVQGQQQQHPPPAGARYTSADRGPPPQPGCEVPSGALSRATGTQYGGAGGFLVGAGGCAGGDERIHASLAAIERKLLLQEERLVYELAQVRLMKKLLRVQQMKQLVREAMRDKERFEEAGEAAATGATAVLADGGGGGVPDVAQLLMRQGSLPASSGAVVAAVGPAALAAALTAANGGAGLDAAAVEALRGALGELVVQRGAGLPEGTGRLAPQPPRQQQQPLPPQLHPQLPCSRRTPTNAADADIASMYDDLYGRMAGGYGGLHRIQSGIELGAAAATAAAAGKDEAHGAGGVGAGRLLSYMATLSGKAPPEGRQQQQQLLLPAGSSCREAVVAVDRLRDRDTPMAPEGGLGGSAANGQDKALPLSRQQQQHTQADTGDGGGNAAVGGVASRGAGAAAAAGGVSVISGVDFQGVLPEGAAAGSGLGDKEGIARRRWLQALLLQQHQQLEMMQDAQKAAAAAGATTG